MSITLGIVFKAIGVTIISVFLFASTINQTHALILGVEPGVAQQALVTMKHAAELTGESVSLLVTIIDNARMIFYVADHFNSLFFPAPVVPPTHRLTQTAARRPDDDVSWFSYFWSSPASAPPHGRNCRRRNCQEGPTLS